MDQEKQGPWQEEGIGALGPMPDDDAGESSSQFVAHVVLAEDADVAAMGLLLEQHLQRICSLSPPEGVNGYIWDREPPMVLQVPEGTEKALEVSMRVQECVDDEWFLTYVLREWTKTYTDVCIRVNDEDGEFLLIEAADTLPSWAQPDTTQNRVWIYQAQLHLIPIDASSRDTSLSVSEAVRLVRDPHCATQAPSLVQDKAFARVDAYPAAALTHHHTTLAFLPPNAAKVFATYPQSTAEAVHALESRDAVSVRSIRHLPTPLRVQACNEVDDDAATVPKPPATDAVLVRVTLTRHLYARLSYDRFFAPASLGRRWQRFVELYRLAKRGEPSMAETNDLAVWGRWCDTGAKLVAGLAMWLDTLGRRQMTQMQDALSSSSSSRPTMAPHRYEQFIAALTKYGFFGSELRGSAAWKEREAKAAATAARLGSVSPGSAESSRSSSGVSYRQILSAMQTQDPEKELWQALPLTSQSIPSLQMHEDSEAWLSMAPQDIEALLSGRTQDEAEDASMDRFQSFMSKMQSFLHRQGDVEGALFDDDANFDTLEDGDEAGADADANDSSDSEAERKARMDALVEPLAPGEWGAESAKAHDGSLASDDKAATTVQAHSKSMTHLQPALHPRGEKRTNRLAGLSRLERFDGDSDSDEASLPDDDHDAAEDRAERHRALEMIDDDEPEDDEEDAPIEQDMGDFFEFTRRTLGLSDSQYAEILEERRNRGAFVPSAARPDTWAEKVHDSKSTDSTMSETAALMPTTTTKPSLASLDAALDAMEQELQERTRPSTSKSSGRAMLSDPMEEDEDAEDLNEEETELLHHLLASGMSLPESLQRFATEHDVHNADVEMLGHFLESFKAQNGHPGPVGTLSQRLGVGSLPRDTDRA